MFTISIIVSGVISIFLVLLVFIQNSKGGGLATSFSNGSIFLGPKRTKAVLEKLTWSSALAIVLFSIYASSF